MSLSIALAQSHIKTLTMVERVESWGARRRDKAKLVDMMLRQASLEWEGTQVETTDIRVKD